MNTWILNIELWSFHWVAVALTITALALAAPSHLSETELKATFLEHVVTSAPNGTQLRLARFHVAGPVPAGARLSWIEPPVAIGLVQFEYRWENGAEAMRTTGNAEVLAFGNVAVARVPIKHGELLTHQNVAFERRLLNPFLRTGYYQSFEPLSGLRANGFISVGSVLSPRSTQLPYLVEEGQIVELVQESARLRITMNAKSLQKGRLHDWINVSNPSSHKVLRVQVLGPSKVGLP